MKKTSDAAPSRARFSRFVQLPYSVLEALGSLRSATAAALLSFLARKCFAFADGYADCSYKTLVAALGRSRRSVAQAARLLRELRLVIVERRADRSYRWRIPVLAQEVKADPRGAFVTREMAADEEESCAKVHHHEEPDCTTLVRESAPPPDPIVGSAKPYEIRPEATTPQVEKAPSKNLSPEALKKNQHQETSDDDSLDHENLFRRLKGIGMKKRVALALLRDHDHALVLSTLERGLKRTGIKNLAAYVLCEVKDGGYEEELDWTNTSGSTQRSVSHTSACGEKSYTKPIEAPRYPTAEQRRAEQDAAEREREARKTSYRQSLNVLLARYQQLTEELKARLKAYWPAHLEQMLPNTKRKAEMLKDPKLQRVAWREVMERFFALIDEGLVPEKALERLAA